MSLFIWGNGNWVEADYRFDKNKLVPTLGGKPHPNPQHWHNIRKQALEREQHRCCACNGRERLEAHHRTYARWGKEELGDIYIHCRECHEVFHGERRLAG